MFSHLFRRSEDETTRPSAPRAMEDRSVFKESRTTTVSYEIELPSGKSLHVSNMQESDAMFLREAVLDAYRKRGVRV